MWLLLLGMLWLLGALELFSVCLWSTRFGGAVAEEFSMLFLALGGGDVVEFLMEESELDPVDRSDSGL